jgi:hypothetical protein
MRTLDIQTSVSRSGLSKQSEKQRLLRGVPDDMTLTN